MTEQQFQTYQEQTFDAFCKKVIRNESANAYKELARRAEREVSLSSLSSKEMQSLATMDSYHPYCKVFHVHGNTVKVYHPMLGEILQYISPQRREIILLCYFLDYTDTEIGRMLSIDHKSVNYRRDAALKRLKELLEGYEHG